MTDARQGAWNTMELARLRKLFPGGGTRHCAQVLRRSEASVARQAGVLFARPAEASEEWSAEDDQLLRRAWGVLDSGELRLLLGRPYRKIQARARQLKGARREGDWSRDECRRLKEWFGTRSTAALEVCLSRSRRDIGQKAAELALGKDPRFGSGQRPVKMPRWTKAELDILQRRYPIEESVRLARDLGRSVASVANKANQLGLQKSEEFRREQGRRNVASRYRADSDD